MITDGGGNVAYVPGPNYNTITVTAKRTVPYTFFKLIGLSTGKVAATGDRPDATGARVCELHQCGSHARGSAHRHPGKHLQHRRSMRRASDRPRLAARPTRFNSRSRSTEGQVGPGNWGSLALGGTGGSNERTNIGDGYQGPLAINQWVDTEPGFKKGPVDQGFADRLAQADSQFPSGTFLDA